MSEYLDTPQRLAVTALLTLLLAGVLSLAAPAGALASYGGLGVVGKTIGPGTEGKHGQINSGGQSHGHAFAANPTTGEFYVADELEVKEVGKKPKTYVRLQAFSSSGGFLAENRVKVSTRIEEEEEVTVERVSSLAVDPTNKKVYLLLAESRAENKAEVAKALRQLEKETTATEKKVEATTKKVEHATEPEKKALEEELSALKRRLAEELAEETKLGNEEEALDSADSSAADLYSFSTEVKSEKLTGEKLLTSSEALRSASETPKASLLYPSGIAVDPKTGDVVISGQQNEAASPKEEEDLRAVIQRVHANGELGPRYVDSSNCLDGAEPTTGEPACAEDEQELPISPVVTPSGRVYVQDGEEVWEMPASAEAEKGYREIPATPRFLVWLAGLETLKAGEQRVLKGVFSEEEGGTLSFVPGKAGEGTFYMRAELPNAGENGAMVLHYVESGANGAPEAQAVGWTGGQEAISSQTKCIVRGGLNEQPLVAGTTNEGLLMLSYESGVVMSFGPGGEGCGHQPTVTPPSVEAAHKAHVTQVTLGETARLSSHIEGARGKTTRWKFVYEEKGVKHEETVETKYAIGKQVLLEHKFDHEGSYEITEEVATDELAFPTLVAETIKLTVFGTKVHLGLPESATAQSTVAIKAKVEDAAETPLVLKATWKFGDGQEETRAYEGADPATIEATHTYEKRGEYRVEVVVLDAGERTATDSKALVVVEGPAEKKQHEEEAQARKAAEEAQARKAAEEGAAAQKAAEEAGARKRAEEELAKRGVLAFQSVHVAVSTIGVAHSGSLKIRLSCPRGGQRCAGSFTLRTIAAVKAGRKKRFLALAGGPFSIASGQTELLTLRLSSTARALLLHSHLLRAKSTFVARDEAGAGHTTLGVVTLRLLKH